MTTRQKKQRPWIDQVLVEKHMHEGRQSALKKEAQQQNTEHDFYDTCLEAAVAADIRADLSVGVLEELKAEAADEDYTVGLQEALRALASCVGDGGLPLLASIDLKALDMKAMVAAARFDDPVSMPSCSWSMCSYHSYDSYDTPPPPTEPGRSLRAFLQLFKAYHQIGLDWSSPAGAAALPDAAVASANPYTELHRGLAMVTAALATLQRRFPEVDSLDWSEAQSENVPTIRSAQETMKQTLLEVHQWFRVNCAACEEGPATSDSKYDGVHPAHVRKDTHVSLKRSLPSEGELA
jgi:hypothetical protein